MKNVAASLLVGALFSLWAWGQTIVKADQGKPGTQGPWPVTIAGFIGLDGGVQSGGAHGACTNTTMNVGTTGTACPATARSDRASILIELIQPGETLTITSDGTTAATATVGVAISDSSGYIDNLSGSVAANCRCTAATCSVRIVECPTP